METTHRFCLAPIRGITDLVYRNCFAELFKGIDFAVAPFVQTVKGNQVKGAHLQENTASTNLLPTTPQIITRNPNHFVDLAKQLADAGNTAVNWNLGCPYPTMTKKRCGSGLLPYPEEVHRFLEDVCSRLPLTLSIKVRLGLEHTNEILQILPLLNQYALDHVTIHPRLGTQMYTGPVDLDCFGRCCDMLEHPVIYNGDITTIEQYHTLQRRFPDVTLWMLGRGLLANPCLVEEIQLGSVIPQPQKTARIRALHTALLEGYCERLSGATHQIQRLVSHWEYLQTSLPFGTRLYNKARKTRSMAEYQTVIGQAFGSGA